MSLSPSVIAKVFRAADTEESGVVDTEVVPTLASKVLGSGVKDSDMQLVRYKAEIKGGEVAVMAPVGGWRGGLGGEGKLSGERDVLLGYKLEMRFGKRGSVGGWQSMK